ncbi:MAG: lipoate--protein ligase family protein, partial [Chloroflexota bacterium]
PATQEIIAQGKKIIGSAQARRKLGVLQHGTLPLIGDLTRISQGLKFDSETERHSASEQLMEKATTVETAFGQGVDWDVAAQAMEDGFGEALNLSFKVSQLSDAEVTRANELEREIYASQDWTNRN